MSGGFPVRPTRATFGPVPQDRHTVVDERKEMPADRADLMFFQIAGLGAISDLAWCTVTGATGVLIAAAEGWDPDNGGPAPEIERSSAGVYVVTYPALVADRKGIEQTLFFYAAKAIPQSTTNFTGHAKVRADGHTVDVTIRNAAGAAADCDFLLELR